MVAKHTHKKYADTAKLIRVFRMQSGGGLWGRSIVLRVAFIEQKLGSFLKKQQKTSGDKPF